MVARQQLGDIFLGITPSAIRQYMLKAFQGARASGRYDRIVIPCAGRFTLAEAAIDAGWKPHQIECSDISLFSSVLGYACSEFPLEDLGIAFHGDLQHLHARARARGDLSLLPGAVLYALKVCQLRETMFYEKTVRDELLRDPDHYIAQLAEQVGQLAEKLKGIRYECRDIVDVCTAASSDARALVYCNPPGFAKGYAKMFDTQGQLTWSDPRIPEFDARSGRIKLYQLLMPAPALAYVFRSKAIEEGYEGKAVFAAERGRAFDYVLCNRPDEAETLVKQRNETKIAPAKLPFMPDDYEITEQSVLGFIEVNKTVALYYRDLFAHKLPATRTERYFLMTIDGYLAAVLGMHFSDLMMGKSTTVHETFGFTAPSKRYPRMNHLFMMAITNEDARKFFSRMAHGALNEADRFQTTCISTTPEQKSHRSTKLKLVNREPWGDGRFKLVYGGAFRNETMAQTVASWLKKMRAVEKQPGKPMGVTMIPDRLVKEEETA